MKACPVDMEPCCDDICHGAGCIKSCGEDMIEICHLCNEPKDEYGCECDDDDDFYYDD